MKSKDKTCSRLPQAVAYAQGELAGFEAADFERHAGTCEACRTEWRSAQTLLAGLKAWPARPVTRDLAPDVLARIRNLKPARRPWLVAACAAVLFLAAGGWWWVRPDARQSAIREAAQWLVNAQREDGRWEGNKRESHVYDPALTGLGLLAGLEFERVRGMSEACRKAVGWLVAGQSENGRLGGSFSGSPYNQGIGTLALLAWFEAHPEPGWRETAAKAVRHIVESQGHAGGWGYAEGDPAPNVSITIWQLQALRKAESLGLAEATPALRRGLRWLRTTRNDRGLYGYRRPDDYPAGSDALTAMSVLCELDCDSRAGQREDVKRSFGEVLSGAAAGKNTGNYYSAFFVARVLQQAGGRETEALLGQVQRALLVRQVRRGDERGSWEPADAYSGVGGPVYATTMAVLALKE
jgi:hypothetical protein